MASGIKVGQDCKEMYIAIQKDKKKGFAIMTCGEKEICVENSQCPHPDKTPETSERIFDEMKETILKFNEPRYILFDFSYTRNSGGFKDVPIYIFWCPDCTGIKQKMKYASSSEYLKKAFSGIQHFECHDLDEFSYKEIAEELRKKDRQ